MDIQIVKGPNHRATIIAHTGKGKMWLYSNMLKPYNDMLRPNVSTVSINYEAVADLEQDIKNAGLDVEVR